jgi:pimeloyl-ACP methyl ester carboxylesterase
MSETPTAADYIEPLHINGMSGRMLYLPAKLQKRELLVIYGHHSTLERWWGLVENFNDFGAVTMPDLPGFGGMDSFYKIGRQATLDNYADYLAAFIKMRYRHKKVSIVGISFGFLVVTRMLQLYPELCSRVEFLISAMGFMHYNNFKFSPLRYNFYRYTADTLSIPPFPYIFRHTALAAPVLRLFYSHGNNSKHKFAYAKTDEQKKSIMDMEVELWHSNDVRTWLRTTVEMTTVDNTDSKVDLLVWHVHTINDNYFDNTIIEQQMRVVFNDFLSAPLKVKSHTPSVIANKKEAAVFIPTELRKILRTNVASQNTARK